MCQPWVVFGSKPVKDNEIESDEVVVFWEKSAVPLIVKVELKSGKIVAVAKVVIPVEFE